MPPPRLPFVLQTLLLLQGLRSHPSFKMTVKVSSEGWDPCWERRMRKLITLAHQLSPDFATSCCSDLDTAAQQLSEVGRSHWKIKPQNLKRGKQLTPRVISLHDSKPIWHQLPKCRLFKDLCGYCSLYHPPGSFSFPPYSSSLALCCQSRCSLKQSNTESNRPKLPSANGFLGHR